MSAPDGLLHEWAALEQARQASEDRAYYIETAHWSWVQSWRGGVLHAIAETSHVGEGGTQAQGRTACGRSGVWCLPGFLTRGHAPRCMRCCTKLGYPQGTGSPKNDAACRGLVEARISSARDVEVSRHEELCPKCPERMELQHVCETCGFREAAGDGTRARKT